MAENESFEEDSEPKDLAWHEYIARVAITMTDYEPEFGVAERDTFLDDLDN